jgi:hypothetical protein
MMNLWEPLLNCDFKFNLRRDAEGEVRDMQATVRGERDAARGAAREELAAAAAAASAEREAMVGKFIENKHSIKIEFTKKRNQAICDGEGETLNAHTYCLDRVREYACAFTLNESRVPISVECLFEMTLLHGGGAAEGGDGASRGGDGGGGGASTVGGCMLTPGSSWVDSA